MKSKLDQLERYLQNIFESSAHLLKRDARLDLVRKLIAAMEEEINLDNQASISVPNAIIVRLHPKQYALWQTDEELLDSFSAALQEAAVEVGIPLLNRPVIYLESDGDLAETELQVNIIRQEEKGLRTAILEPENANDNTRKRSLPQKAFLILESGDYYPIERAAINIGRRTESEVYINDPHISREHAQIRLVQESYVLFDLNSTSGTYVNGRKIVQHNLQPGDVISISGHPLIYVEENVNPSDTDDEPRDITRTARISTSSDEYQEEP